MKKIKPMSCSKERFLSLVEAFLGWSMAWGIKVVITMKPTEVKEKEDK